MPKHVFHYKERSYTTQLWENPHSANYNHRASGKWPQMDQSNKKNPNKLNLWEKKETSSHWFPIEKHSHGGKASNQRRQDEPPAIAAAAKHRLEITSENKWHLAKHLVENKASATTTVKHLPEKRPTTAEAKHPAKKSPITAAAKHSLDQWWQSIR